MAASGKFLLGNPSVKIAALYIFWACETLEDVDFNPPLRKIQVEGFKVSAGVKSTCVEEVDRDENPCSRPIRTDLGNFSVCSLVNVQTAIDKFRKLVCTWLSRKEQHNLTSTTPSEPPKNHGCEEVLHWVATEWIVYTVYYHIRGQSRL